jgi:hypothetical protein
MLEVLTDATVAVEESRRLVKFFGERDQVTILCLDQRKAVVRPSVVLRLQRNTSFPES